MTRIATFDHEGVVRLARQYQELRQRVQSLEAVLRAMRADGPGYKLLVRVTLEADLLVSDENKSATITDQFGPGADAPTSTGWATVHNFETHTSGSYEFHADDGDALLCYWMYANHYQIVIPECP